MFVIRIFILLLIWPLMLFECAWFIGCFLILVTGIYIRLMIWTIMMCQGVWFFKCLPTLVTRTICLPVMRTFMLFDDLCSFVLFLIMITVINLSMFLIWFFNPPAMFLKVTFYHNDHTDHVFFVAQSNNKIRQKNTEYSLEVIYS